jgi:methyl-accepting chemotaxis protein
MRLNGKLLVFNAGIPLALVIAMMTAAMLYDAQDLLRMRSRDCQQAAERFAAILESQIAEKSQYLQDQARLPVTRALYGEAIQSFDQADWEKSPLYRSWKEAFAAGQAYETDVIRTYVGYKGILPAIGRPWPEMEPGYHANSLPWYFSVLEINDLYISSPYPIKRDGQDAIGVTLSYPIHRLGADPGEAGDIIGVVAADLDMSGIERLAADAEAAGLYRIGVYDWSGGMLYDGTYRELVESGLMEDVQASSFADFYRAADPTLDDEALDAIFYGMTGPSGSLIYGWRGRQTLSGYAKAASGAWIVTLTAPVSDVIGPDSVRNLVKYLVIVGMLCLALLTGTLIMRQTVIKNVKSAAAALADIAKADADMTRRLKVSSRDEVGDVGRNFNAFVERLRELAAGVKAAIGEVDGIGERVSSAAAAAQASVSQAASAQEAMGGQTGALREGLARVVASIGEIDASVSSIDDQIAGQAGMVDESTAAINQMMASLGNVNNIASAKLRGSERLKAMAAEGRGSMDGARGIFSEVVERVGAIQEMAEAIDAIASQTNLLSMNAAIEAAHAGDAGRGFAVVAEEIRRLSETAAESSRTISELVGTVSQAVAGANLSVQDSAKVFDAVQEEIVDTVDAFTEIGRAIAELSAGGRQVMEASERIKAVTAGIREGSAEIAGGTSRILESSEEIRDAAAKVDEGMGEINASNRRVLEAMREMVGQAATLDAVVESLKEKFGAFKT